MGCKIKICGIFREADIEFVNHAMPDYIGFVFAESKRRVGYADAAMLRKRLSPEITPVGVFTNADINDIKRLYEENVINVAQLHGGESEEYVRELKSLCSIPVILAVGVRSKEDIRLHENTAADFIMFDNKTAGSGESFDWSLVSEIKRPFFLAGGINGDNIKAAVKLNPYCVDVSSGAETNGVKDENKISALVAAVRQL